MDKNNTSDRIFKDCYDVIIIGSGIGGLTCGALLAKEGYSVLIAEQFSSYGGVCQSIKKDGFILDAAVHIAYNWPHFERVLGELGEKLEVREVRKKEALIFPRHKLVMESIPQIRDSLMGMFPQESESIKQYYNNLIELAEVLNEFNRMELVTTGKIFKYKEYLEKNTSQVVNECFKDEYLKAIVNAVQSGYMYTYPWIFTAFYLYNTRGEARKEYLPVSGSQPIADAFVRAFRKNGGCLVLDSLVVEILLDNHNQAASVRLDDGRIIKAAKAVVSNADARLTFDHLLPQAKQNEKNRKLLNLWKQCKESVGYLVAYYGFDIDVASYYNLDEDLIAYFPSYDVNRMCEDIYLRNILPDDFWLWIMFPSMTHPEMAPPGHSQAILALPVKYGFENNFGINGDYYCDGLRWKGRTGSGYQEFKERIGRLFLKRTEELFPGISSHVVFKDVWTPISFEKNTLNYKGSSMGWELNSEQLKHTGKMGLPLTTCFPRLYLTGNWTEAGAAAWSASASGEKVAKMIMSQNY